MNNDFFDIDSILEEFSSYSAELSTRGESGDTSETELLQDAPAVKVPELSEDKPARDDSMPTPVQEPAPRHESTPDRRRDADGQSRMNTIPNEDRSPETDRLSAPSRRERRTDEPPHHERRVEGNTKRSIVPAGKAKVSEDKDEEEPRRFSPKLPAFLSRPRTGRDALPKTPDIEDEYDESDDEYIAPEEVKPAKLRIGGLRRIAAVVFAVLAVLSLYWLVNNIHPSIGVSETMRTDSKMDLVSKIDVFANNSKSDALGELAYVRKIYTIDRSAPCGPKPDPDGYVTYSIDEADQVMELVNRARATGLLDGQDVIFDPSVDFYHDSDIQCYFDDTILVICWKELIDGRVCSCVEVKIADASQLRRKLTEDYYGSSVTQYTTQMAASVNAVTAMNADYYMFRTYGIVVYQGEIYRYETSCDTLFIDDNGDFSFMRRYDDPGQEATQQFVYENHIQFSISFGPVLIENGEVQYLTDNYGGLGEMNMEYSRAAIGQYDTLHYLYMAVSHSNDSTPRATVNQFADIIATKNLRHAYNLDGGQTGEVVFNGKPYNHIDFGNERLLSDCIYFCTAIPESEVNG